MSTTDDLDFSRNEVVSQFKDSLKLASETIYKLMTELCEKDQSLEQLSYLKGAVVMNKVLSVRHQLMKE